MSGLLRTAGLLLLCLVLCTIQGCSNDDDDWGQVGEVQLLDVGTDCWVIKVDNDSVQHGFVYFEPDNLPDGFRVNGLWVRFEYVLPEEWASICMLGEGIIITRIEAL